MITDSGRDLIHGTIGTITPVLGVVTSMQEQVEWGLRVGSLLVGLLVGLISLFRLLKNR